MNYVSSVRNPQGDQTCNDIHILQALLSDDIQSEQLAKHIASHFGKPSSPVSDIIDPHSANTAHYVDSQQDNNFSLCYNRMSLNYPVQQLCHDHAEIRSRTLYEADTHYGKRKDMYSQTQGDHNPIDHMLLQTQLQSACSVNIQRDNHETCPQSVSSKECIYLPQKYESFSSNRYNINDHSSGELSSYKLHCDKMGQRYDTSFIPELKSTIAQVNNSFNVNCQDITDQSLSSKTYISENHKIESEMTKSLQHQQTEYYPNNHSPFDIPCPIKETVSSHQSISELFDSYTNTSLNSLQLFPSETPCTMSEECRHFNTDLALDTSILFPTKTLSTAITSLSDLHKSQPLWPLMSSSGTIISQSSNDITTTHKASNIYPSPIKPYRHNVSSSLFHLPTATSIDEDTSIISSDSIKKFVSLNKDVDYPFYQTRRLPDFSKDPNTYKAPSIVWDKGYHRRSSPTRMSTQHPPGSSIEGISQFPSVKNDSNLRQTLHLTENKHSCNSTSLVGVNSINRARQRIAPLPKEQLVELLAIACMIHNDVSARVESVILRSPSCRRLMVRNISFQATDADFREFMEQFGAIEDCAIVREPDKTSRGFGFVTFAELRDADKLLIIPSGKLIFRQRQLFIKLASDPFAEFPDATTSIPHIRSEPFSRREVFARNLPPTTSESDLRQLLEYDGTIIDCRVVPAGRNDTAFGFVLFESWEGAMKAVQQPQRCLGNRSIFLSFASKKGTQKKKEFIRPSSTDNRH